MRFISFPQATAAMKIDGEGQIPFVIEGHIGVMCLELTEGDLAAIRANKNKLFILAPLMPSGDRPVYVKVMPKDPFVSTMQVNGKTES